MKRDLHLTPGAAATKAVRLGRPEALAGLGRRGALAGLAALAACSSRLPDYGEDARRPADLRFTMRDGAVLPARQWLPPAGTSWRGVILALHGFDDSRDQWELSAPSLAAAGWAVFAPDQRGFGEAPGRDSWPGTQVLIDDAAELTRQLRAAHPALPVVVMGESMGGAIAICLDAETHLADRTILVSPAVWSRAQIGPVMHGAIWAAARIAPNWRLTGREVNLTIIPSDNRDALLRLARDPLTIRATRIATVEGLAGLMDRAAQDCPRLGPHVLALAGRRDTLIPPSSMAAAWARMPATTRRAFYPEGYHLLLRDRDRALVVADILAWLDDPGQYLPSAADAATAAWVADHGWDRDPTPALPAAGLDGIGERPVWPF